MRKKGFTLIELLVVISIIALLLSVILPSLNKVKETARAVLCTSNQRQMGIFFFMYSDENDGTMVEMYNTSGGPGAPYTWSERFFYEMKYTNSSEVFYCPSAKLPIGGNRKWPAEYEAEVVHFPGTSVPNSSQGGYVYGLRSAVFFDLVHNPIKIKDIRTPSRFMLLTDTSDVFHDFPDARTPWWMFDAWHSIAMLHKKSASILMADGSAGVHKLDDMIGLIAQQKDPGTNTPITWDYSTDPAMYFLDGTKLYADGRNWPN